MFPRGRLTRLLPAALLALAAGHLTADAQAATAVSGKDKPAAPAAASNAAVLELLREIDGLKREVQALRGQVEDKGHEIEQLRKIVTDIERRVPAGATAGGEPLETLVPPAGGSVAGTPAPESSLQVETQAPTLPGSPEGFEPDPAYSPPPPRTPGTAASPPAGYPAPPASGTAAPGVAANTPVPAADSAASESAYREAFGLLRAADYAKAAAAFTAFQAAYPGSQYGDSAQYWLAEALAADGKHDKAAAEYQKLMVQFPASKKMPYAMLKLGDSYEKLGKAKEAKAVWAELRKQFPTSAAAKLAEQRPGVAPPAR